MYVARATLSRDTRGSRICSLDPRRLLRWGMRLAVLLAAFAAMLATSLASCIEKSCSAVGCTSGALMKITTVPDPSTLDGAALTVCLNGRCSSATLHANDVFVQLAGEVTVDGYISETSHGFEVDAEVENLDTHDGDVYSATITASGSTIASTTGTATYHTYYPNGEDCGGGCSAATLTP
jgi:hypothetical protein